jgi:hypothetical protein
MGFTTWNYASSNDAVEDTYDFIANHGDIYAEQIDEYIPWRSLISSLDYPDDFKLKMQFKSLQKPPDMKLCLSVSFLDTDRSALLPDADGFLPEDASFDNDEVMSAYGRHLEYLIDKFNPQYFVFAMEVNELFIKDQVKWESYQRFSSEIRTRLKGKYPDLPIAESITLHALINPETDDAVSYHEAIRDFVEDQDFTAVSFYPFLTGLSEEFQFQTAFDFLHELISKPIAFVETNHLAETLEIEAFDLKIESDECEQKVYLETLLNNAQAKDYEFVIWWSHRDYDELWKSFPAEVKNIGKIWRDTGLLDEDGNRRIALDSWEKALNQ